VRWPVRSARRRALVNVSSSMPSKQRRLGRITTAGRDLRIEVGSTVLERTMRPHSSMPPLRLEDLACLGRVAEITGRRETASPRQVARHAPAAHRAYDCSTAGPHPPPVPLDGELAAAEQCGHCSTIARPGDHEPAAWRARERGESPTPLAAE